MGDRIQLESERAGQPAREGEVLEVVARGAGVHYRVRWLDGHESVLFPSAGNVKIVPAKKDRAAKAR